MTRMQRFCVRAVMVCSLAVADAQTVEVVNHQPFPIAMPWRLHDGNTVMVDVAASGRQTIDLALREPAAAGMRVEPVENGIGLNFDGRDLGALSWDIMVQK